MFKKLKTMIVVSFFAVTVLFFAGFSTITYKLFFDFTAEEISEARLSGVNESMSRVSSFIASVRDAGIYLVTNRSVIQLFSYQELSNYDAILEQRKISEMISDVISVKQGIYSIELYTDRYNSFPMIAGSGIFNVDSLREAEWFPYVEQTERGWLPKHESPHSDQAVVSYFHQLLDQRGNTVGYVMVNVLADTFFESIYEEHFSQATDEHHILIDSGNRVIGQTNIGASQEVLSLLISESGENDSVLLEKYSGLFHYYEILEQDNRQYLLVISRLNEDRWRLVHLVPIDALYSEAKKIGFYVLILSIVCLVLLFPISFWIGKSLLRPISRIIQGMKEVEKGNFQARVEPHSIEEYKTLAENFNRMTYQLDQSLQELKRENRAKRGAELRTLQNQIVPHFLYNTLDMIHWRAMDYQAEDISYMVNQLSKMYRIGLSGGQSFIRLREELEHVGCYINLQQSRLRTTITYETAVPAAMKDVYVPKIILQPFVENSMKHGYPNGFPDEIQLCIIAAYKDTYLEIKITDNGIGLPDGWQLEKCSGIGVKNIKERIWMYCGPEYSVDLDRHEGGGTAVLMKLPIINDKRTLESFINKKE
ncbi:HAMP domain-containing protein [Evansella caseinilytica]|uniref:HAMP domain-containing protein n=1 Tax=Evansella caseinilytica TaxID=1503961 RepID=A0A1H3IGY0_9BACI|nr:sensor histidine kinase [Evansella caseinilytica]SDY26635.1 HAMP domain-containing protein [Evansella caseinilytica]